VADIWNKKNTNLIHELYFTVGIVFQRNVFQICEKNIFQILRQNPAQVVFYDRNAPGNYGSDGIQN